MAIRRNIPVTETEPRHLNAAATDDGQVCISICTNEVGRKQKTLLSLRLDQAAVDNLAHVLNAAIAARAKQSQTDSARNVSQPQ